jgi:tetratricopeptide (TPR) repeat protein
MKIFNRLFGRKGEPHKEYLGTSMQSGTAEPAKGDQDAIALSDADKAYAERCLTHRYKEQDESRAWHTDPIFSKVLDPLNEGNYGTACEEAEKLVVQVRDFHGIYYWWGSALREMGNLEQARDVLLRGLEVSKSKFPLCEMMARVEWKAGNPEDAVYWWTQAIHGQESIKYYNDESAYLHMAYVAQGVGLQAASKALFSRVDLSPGGVRLKEAAASSLRELVRPKRPLISEVVRQVVTTYIVPEKKEPAKAASQEAQRFIRQLEEVATNARWADETEDAQAAKRLGELGDPRAIPVLTKVARSGMVYSTVRSTADEAIRRINEANR